MDVTGHGLTILSNVMRCIITGVASLLAGTGGKVNLTGRVLVPLMNRKSHKSQSKSNQSSHSKLLTISFIFSLAVRVAPHLNKLAFLTNKALGAF